VFKLKVVLESVLGRFAYFLLLHSMRLYIYLHNPRALTEMPKKIWEFQSVIL